MRAELYIKRHLIKLYRFAKFFGLLHFRYDLETSRLHTHQVMHIVYHKVVCALAISVVLITIYLDFSLMQRNIRHSEYVQQDVLLFAIRELCGSLSALCYYVNFLKHQQLLVEILKQFLKIYENFRNAGLGADLRHELASYKVQYLALWVYVWFIFVLRLVTKLFYQFDHILDIVLLSLAKDIMPMLIILAQQLSCCILLSFLACLGRLNDKPQRDERGCFEHAMTVVQLAHDCYRLRRKLNEFLSLLFLGLLFQLLYNGYFLYECLKLLFYEDFLASIAMGIFDMSNGLMNSLVFLIFANYSERLCAQEQTFLNDQLLTNIHIRSDKPLEYLMLCSKVHPMSLTLFGQLRIDRHFAGQLLRNIVLFHVLSFLQCYHSPSRNTCLENYILKENIPFETSNGFLQYMKNCFKVWNEPSAGWEP